MAFTLNVFTLNCWGIPGVSKNRRERFAAIGAYLLKSPHNIVCLQEVWSENDYLTLKNILKGNLPYSHYFYRNAAAITNAFHDPITDNVNASGFMEKINNRVNMENCLAQYVIDYNLNSRRIPFQSMSAELPDVRGFPRLSEEELVMFALGTYQIKLARSYYSEHARNGVYTIEVYRENDDLNNLLNNYNITGNNFWLLRGKVQSRHTRSRIYHTYILVNSDHLGLEALNHYYCSCKSGRRTLGTCAHVMSIVWFLAYARYENIDHPAQFLDSIVIDENDL